MKPINPLNDPFSVPIVRVESTEINTSFHSNKLLSQVMLLETMNGAIHILFLLHNAYPIFHLITSLQMDIFTREK